MQTEFLGDGAIVGGHDEGGWTDLQELRGPGGDRYLLLDDPLP